ncbi:hypothetical protein E8E12_003188 [Didymella heteroderae]|uniref:Uncharacterized protein n=1 Tax=Didymella heteroderae TaxID=1769908 RepID=A0A9P4WVX5_9PLEO|nr:hypothetical protein E8E12_003188 [Didymella heteroderae]
MSTGWTKKNPKSIEDYDDSRRTITMVTKFMNYGKLHFPVTEDNIENFKQALREVPSRTEWWPDYPPKLTKTHIDLPKSCAKWSAPPGSETDDLDDVAQFTTAAGDENEDVELWTPVLPDEEADHGQLKSSESMPVDKLDLLDTPEQISAWKEEGATYIEALKAKFGPASEEWLQKLVDTVLANTKAKPNSNPEVKPDPDPEVNEMAEQLRGRFLDIQKTIEKHSLGYVLDDIKIEEINKTLKAAQARGDVATFERTAAELREEYSRVMGDIERFGYVCALRDEALLAEHLVSLGSSMLRGDESAFKADVEQLKAAVRALPKRDCGLCGLLQPSEGFVRDGNNRNQCGICYARSEVNAHH